jgi:hypothetical protein
MPRRLPSLILLLLLVFAAQPLLQAAELVEGMSQVEVEAILGKPTSVLHRGNRTLLLYPKKGRVEFEDNRAVLFSNVQAPADPQASAAVPKSVEGGPPPPPAPASPLTAKPTAVAPTKSANIPTSKVFAPAKADELTNDDKSDIAKQQALFADAVQQMSEKPRSFGIEQRPPSVGYWTALLVECLVRVLITVVVLKLAFHWAEVHADWGQMWLPALADSLSRAGIAAAALRFWHTTQLFHIDDGVSYFVLLITLMKTTHACTLPRAVAVTMAAKLASLIVWVLVSVALLNLLA